MAGEWDSWSDCICSQQVEKRAHRALFFLWSPSPWAQYVPPTE